MCFFLGGNVFLFCLRERLPDVYLAATVFRWQNFREMLALVKAQEKIVKALSQVDPRLPSHFACQSHLPDRYMFVDVPGS